MARPTSLNDLVSQAICNAIADGNTRQCACALAGVSYASMKGWMVRGRKGEEPYATFLAKLEKADALAEAPMVEKIRGGGQGWQGALAWLQYRRRTTWRKPPQPVEQQQGEDLTGADEETLWAAVQKLKPQKEKKTG